MTPNDKPFILFCAGEDSGDAIGYSLVKCLAEFSNLKAPILAKGSGGFLMESAGLIPLINFEDLPVSGFLDVLPKYFILKNNFKILAEALKSKNCLGLVAIDYPGFNMKLVKLASDLKKPALYVAPPQIFAWKQKRGKILAKNRFVKLAVFFEFEKEIYQKFDCNVCQVQHPFFYENFQKINENSISKKNDILILPGSRKKQALRNLPLFLQVASKISLKPSSKILVVASRKSLAIEFENFIKNAKGIWGKSSKKITADFISKIQIVLASKNPQHRFEFYKNAGAALTSPGTATLELALASCPMVTCTKPDFITYHLAKFLLKNKHFSLPNLILNQNVIQEFVAKKIDINQVSLALKNASENLLEANQISTKLFQKLSSKISAKNLMSEFLRQFF